MRFLRWSELVLGSLAIALAGGVALSLIWKPDPHGFALLGVVTFGGLSLLFGAAATRLQTPWCWILQIPVLAYAGWFLWFMFG